ncbi:MAG: hypothetical protein CMN85_10905 [Spongiibacteraceae bacterium]|uniref:hypothetical protein n=1 Tax=uncultured Haliea sp. TaxID=622616 RepID=UPI000C524300|nr:hypothetical protein [Spongiibacteraceae bacterium]|tara:strand:+ start:18945 stop:19154 length:210 start_codon:yes stop_codon:yes gene_type:complete
MKINCPHCGTSAAPIWVRVSDEARPHSPGTIDVRVIGKHFYENQVALGPCEFSGAVVTPDQYEQLQWQE